MREYRCCQCGAEFERLEFRHDHAAPTCRDCGSRNVERMVSAPGRIVFKGDGWAKDGYAKKPSGAKRT